MKAIKILSAFFLMLVISTTTMAQSGRSTLEQRRTGQRVHRDGISIREQRRFERRQRHIRHERREHRKVRHHRRHHHRVI